MPDRFDSYSPETAKLMKAALEQAWEQVESKAQDVELSRLLLASAIIDHVNGGITDLDELAGKALRALADAKNISGERLRLKERRTPAPPNDEAALPELPKKDYDGAPI